MPAPQGEISVVEREIRIDAEPETVFPFFTDPEKMVRWIGISATLDPRAGGVFSVNTVGDYFFAGEYLAVEPNSRVVFTWGYGNFPPEEQNPLPVGSSTVEVELMPDGDGTIVRLTHRLPAALDAFHAMGWEHYLERLAIVVPGGDPGHDAFREAFEAMIAGDD